MKMNSVLTLVKGFVCEGCVEATKAMVQPDEKLSFYDQEIVKIFGILGTG